MHSVMIKYSSTGLPQFDVRYVMEVVRDPTPAKLPDLHDYATGSAMLQQSACWRVRPN